MFPRTTNVLIVTNLFPTPADPARGVFTARLVRALRERCDVTVVCPLPWLPAWMARGAVRRLERVAGVPSAYEIDGVLVHSPKYSIVPRGPRLRTLSMFAGLWPTVAALHRQHRFDVINCHWLHPDGVASTWLGQWLNVPVVLTALGSDVNVLLDDRRARAQIIAALHRADAITTKSAQLRSRIIAVGIRAELVSATVNGVDSGCFVIRDQDASARALGIPVAERRLLFVGKLARIKGLPSLLKAFASIAAEDRTLALYIVGDGCDRSLYEEIARERGIEDRVRFVGAQHPTRIPLWLGAADLLCLPSVDEGCPNVVLEALASGRPVVASAVGGVPDLVRSSSGLLVPAGDEAALAAALRCALRRQWDASTIRSHVLRRTWADAAEGYHAVYGRVIRARRPSAAASGARYSRLASHSG